MILKKISAVVVAGTMLVTSAPSLVWAEQLPAMSYMQSAAPSEYRLSKYDVLNIVIIGLSDSYFNDIMIGPDGYVNLPYAGSIKLAGLTVAEATDILTQRLGEYVKIPGMSLMIKQYAPRKIYVMGAVNHPGIYSLTSDYMNVFAALSSAGGIAKKGRTKKIAVVRVENGKVNLQEIDIKKFIEKQDVTQNVALLDGDMVYVPESNKVDLYEDVLPLVNAYGMFRALTK